MGRLRIGAALLLLALLPAQAESNLLARIGVIGASASDGVGSGVPLSSLLRVGVQRQGIVVDRANQHLGSSPLRTTERSVELLVERDATLVVAADLFFWYGYRFSSQEERETKLAAGLAALERLDCPMLIGTVPKLDAQRIPPQNQPSAEQLAQLNATIEAWAAERDNVRVLPFDTILDAFRAGKSITLAGKPFTVDPERMFQRDGIHLTVDGQAMLGMLILDAIRELPQVADDQRSHFVRELDLLRDEALELTRLKTLAKPTLRALKHLSRQADDGPVEAAKLKEVLSKQLQPAQIDRALTWLEAEQALTREGTALTPIKGVEPVRR